jgi:subtilase family serine protease
MPGQLKHARLTAAALSAAVVLSLHATTALAGVPFPAKDTPAAADLGALDATSAKSTPLTVTVAMKLRDIDGAEQLLHHVSTPGDPLYRQFLTTAQFQARFAPTAATIAAVHDALASFGLTVERASTTTLRVTGKPADLERAFGVTLHVYHVAAHGGVPAYTYHAPTQGLTLPAAIAPAVHTVFGLDTRPSFHPNYSQAAARLPAPASHVAAGKPGAYPDEPGNLTVIDFEHIYNVTPLYKAGITGAGKTIGIATLANFTPSDAYTYWSSLGLNVSNSRITIVPVDGGSGPPSDDSGSIETTLDVEQSGGIAPGAAVLVYDAPNTGQGFVDLFAKIADDDLADAVSCSWGEWEWFDTKGNNPVTDPISGKTVSTLTAFHQLFLQLGIQGESLSVAAGDAGAYDVNRGFLPPDFSLALSVDSPGSDPATISAGGTTLPATITFTSPAVTVTIPAERVWSWDYLVPLCNDLDLDPIQCGIFPVGGGGGVSIEFPVPSYQVGVAGVKKSEPDQQLLYLDTVPPSLIYTLPANYAGRNVPDVSMNADPYTGYVIGYTSSASGSSYGLYNEYGGTSFVAPELNGVTQLLAQNAGGRLGLLNETLYALSKTATGYSGKSAPLRAIKAGNNDYYLGRKGYSPAAGVGTLNVANLAVATSTKKQ